MPRQEQFDLGGAEKPGTPRVDPAQAPYLPSPSPSGPKPEQLKMFMSQREIMGGYQPLDADLKEQDDPRGGEWTNRPENTAGFPNDIITTHDRTTPFLQHAPKDAVFYRPFYGVPETHDEMMSRKLDESKLSYEEYADVHRGKGGETARTPGWNTLAERGSAPQYEEGHTGTYDYDLEQYGAKKYSEHRMQQTGSLFGDLEHAMRPGGEGFTGLVHLSHQFGMQGKPQIAGAHHRLSAMGEIDPDRLLPVVHSETPIDAQNPEQAEHYPYS